jgi:hypothetical protein
LEREMTASLETLVVAAYVLADSLSIPRSGPPGKATDQGPIALAAAQAILGIASERRFRASSDLGERSPADCRAERGVH